MTITMRIGLGAILCGLAALGIQVPVHAQTQISALVTATCGTPGITLTAGRPGVVTQNTGGQLCVNVTVSASVAGFSSNGSFGSLTATATTSASTALPSGTVTRITNTSATATVSCTEATGAATGVVNNIIVEPGSSVSRVNGAFDHIACIDQTGSTGSNLVILEGGAGLGNDSGGGGGGGSSGAVFGPTAVGSANANPPVVIGGTVTGAAGQNVEGVAVKPASTAPLATDFALVTVESPNSPVLSALITNSQTTAHGCSTAAYSLLGCVGQLDDDVKGPIPLTVNGATHGQTGLTPGTAQTGTIFAANHDVTSVGGTAVPKGGVPVINGGNTYQLFAASTGPTAFTGGGGGAIGDYLSHCTVFPTTTSPGVVTILDSTTAIYSFPGGASSLSNLVPFAIPVGANSKIGAWNVTLGAGVSMVCEGKPT